MVEDEVAKQLKSVISQHGFSLLEKAPRLKNLLRDIFVETPREMNLLITGLDEGCPDNFYVRKGQSLMRLSPYNWLIVCIILEGWIVRLQNGWFGYGLM